MKLEFSTGRLRLREWKNSDAVPFGRLNADPDVMEFFPSTLSRIESDDMIGRIRTHFEKNGFGLWAVEIPGECDFIGFVGLQIPRFDAHFQPCVEIGWRLDKQHWGKGYATEAAKEVLRVGFNELSLNEIVSMTAVINLRSQRVMQKIGMNYSAFDDFDHPKVPAESELNRHVLYRLSKTQFQT